MLQRIHYIANNRVVLPILSQYVQRSNNFEWIEYSILQRPEVEYLIILEPFRIESELFTLSSAWKPWLKEFRPKTRLIVAAFAQSRHSNCLNLLDLPANLELWLQNVPPVSDFSMANTGKVTDAGEAIFVDTWDFGLSNPGYHLKSQMRKFITGHEETKSFYAQMVDMQQQLNGLQYYYEVVKKDDVSEDEKAKERSFREGLLKNWGYFEHRWHYYSAVLDYVPYQEAINKIQQNIGEMKDVLKSGQYSGAKNPLQEILQIMRKEMYPYIFPEELW